jgi:DNA-binding beta-propeller fold protein YncE
MNETSRMLPNQFKPNSSSKNTIRKGFRRIITALVILSLGFAFFLPLSGTSASPEQVAAAPTDAVTLENVIDTSLYVPPSPDPAGITYLSTADMLLISDSEVDEIIAPNPAAYTGKNLFITDRLGLLDSTLTTYNPPDVTFSNEPSGVAYKPNNSFPPNRELLYFADDNVNRIYELDPGPDGDYNTSDDIVRSYDTDVSPMNCFDPSGITYDGNRDHLFVVDDVGEEVHDIALGANGKLDQSDAVTTFSVTALGIRNPEGIEFNPDNNHLYILSSKTFDRLIGETTIDGKLLRYLDISAANARHKTTFTLWRGELITTPIPSKTMANCTKCPFRTMHPRQCMPVQIS